MNEPQQDTANSLWARLVKVETNVAALSTDSQRTWAEIEKLRQAIHPMASSLSALTMLTERAEVDRGRMITGIERITSQLTTLLPQVATQGERTDDHIRDCDAMNRAKAQTDAERHRENQAAMQRVQGRVSRLEVIYYFGFAFAMLIVVLSSDVGQRLVHHLLPTVSE